MLVFPEPVAPTVYNIDLKDFFPSITQPRVYTCLKNPPFNLKNEKEKLKIANYIASLSCTAMEVECNNKDGVYEKIRNNVLPQGAPTSPIITNVVCQRLDFLLSAVAKRFGLKYSRYADDITFSSQHSVYKKDSEFHEELSRIVKQEGFEIKESKTRLQKQAYRQEVTGLVVNEKVNVQRRYIEQVRKWLYLWKKYGYEHASAIFLPEYLKDKGHIKKGSPNMINVIDGKLSYLKMIKADDDTVYKKLKELYDKCSKDFYKNKSTSKPVLNGNNLDLILDALVNKNLETALSIFKE